MKQLPLIVLMVLLLVPTLLIGGYLLVYLVMGAFAEGDPEAGRKIALDPGQGDCVICHQVRTDDPEQQGNIGPPLMGVADRLSDADLFDRIKDSRHLNPETIMPPYGSTQDLHRVADEFKGKPILTDEEINHVVAWLETLEAE